MVHTLVLRSCDLRSNASYYKVHIGLLLYWYRYCKNNNNLRYHLEAKYFDKPSLDTLAFAKIKFAEC